MLFENFKNLKIKCLVPGVIMNFDCLFLVVWLLCLFSTSIAPFRFSFTE